MLCLLPPDLYVSPPLAQPNNRSLFRQRCYFSHPSSSQGNRGEAGMLCEHQNESTMAADRRKTDCPTSAHCHSSRYTRAQLWWACRARVLTLDNPPITHHLGPPSSFAKLNGGKRSELARQRSGKFNELIIIIIVVVVLFLSALHASAPA